MSVVDAWAVERAKYDELSDWAGEWQGLPIPLSEDTPLVLNRDHPLFAIYEPSLSRSCRTQDVREDETIINHWYSRRRQCDVYIYEQDGRRKVLAVPVSPDRSMDRLTMWLTTLGASDAWSVDAEVKAMETLSAMLTDRQWRHYLLTGTFLETSERSGVTYMFRRLRPTIALSPRGRNGQEMMLCIAVLCLHPIGYYDRTWAGCMVPSDDVIAHLTMCRGDEAHFWGKANKHPAHVPQAGL